MLIYDTEILNAIPPRNASERKPNVIYCNGWDDFAGMKISCLCVWDYQRDCSRVFGESNLAEFQKLIDQHDKIIGFNNFRFDDQLVKANNIVIPQEKSYDILAEIYRSLGSRQSGCSLENVVKANFPNIAKTEKAEFAPELWQRGEQTRVIDYCLNDVLMTKKLVDKILRFGYINNPLDPSKTLKMRRP